MNNAKPVTRHLDDATWWRWRDGELNAEEITAAQDHLENCASCRQHAAAMERLFNALQKTHRAVQPTLAEQIQLRQTLERQFVPKDFSEVVSEASRWLVRWLAPAVAILAAVFLFLRQEPASPSDTLTSLLAETPESELLLTNTDDQLQQTMWEMALSLEDTQK